MTITLSEPQSRAFWSTAKSVGTVAGYGSGKTHLALAKAFDLLYMFPGVPVGYGGPTYGLIEDIFYPAVEKHCLKYDIKYNILKTKHIIEIAGLGNIVCRSLNNPDMIVGFEVGDFLIDEMDKLPTKTALLGWRMAKARCRFKFPKKRLPKPFGGRTKKKSKKNQMHMYTTPEGYKAAYQLFKNKKTRLKNSELIEMSTYSNLHNLPDDYIDELRGNYPPALFRSYVLGKFTNLTSGSVYTSFDRHRNNAPNVNCTMDEYLYVGMDFNIENMSAIIHVLRNGLPVAVNELYGIYDTRKMIEALKEHFPKNHIIVYPDASGDNRSTSASLTDLALLEEAGFSIEVNAKNPRIKDRVNSMNGMFYNAKKEIRYRINKDNCPQYVECLEQQAYDKAGLPDKTQNNDHLNDAGGYFIEKEFGIIKPISNMDINFNN